MKLNEKLYPLDKIGFVEIVDRFQQDLGLKVVNSARISYNKQSETYTERDKKLVTYLWDYEHSSPFRHSFITFHVKMPIFVARQWMKYQVGSCWRTYEVDGEEVSLEIIDHFYDEDKGCSWNEISRRYTSEDIEFFNPEALRGNSINGNKQSSGELNISTIEKSKLHCMISQTIIDCYDCYKKLIASGVAKEQARMILPQNMYIEAYWTVSLQSIIHFLKQRLAPAAQLEIRCYAESIKELLSEELESLGIEL